MKSRIKHLIALGVLSTSLISNHFVVQAVDKPTPPNEIEGEVTNEKIKEYNKKAEEYNLQVDDYNKQIDNEYDSALASVKQQNEEIDKHNAAEEEKARAVEATNTQLQEEYNALYEQYQKDLEDEALVKSYGYESVEAYNAVAEANNAKVETAESINGDASAVFDISKSYTITAAEETPSDESDYVDTSEPEEPEKVKVNITHSFMGYKDFTTSFEILETDTITFYAAGAQCTPTEPDLCQFYMYSDGNLVKGYWSQSFSQVMCNAVTHNEDWNNGDTHTITYLDGKNHPSDSTDIDIEYYYYWTDLKLAKVFNVPKEPTLNLETYTPDIKEHIAEPTRGEYLEHIKLKDLLPEQEVEPVPEPKPQPQPEPTPEPEPEPAPAPTPQPDPTPDPEPTPSEDPEPAPADDEQKEETEEKEDSDKQKEEKEDKKDKKDEDKKKKKEKKEESKKEEEPQQQQQAEQEETHEEQSSSIVTPIPAQTQITPITETPKIIKARASSTGDNKKSKKQRLMIIFGCILILVALSISDIIWNKKHDDNNDLS